jgi:TolA-binding protein
VTGVPRVRAPRVVARLLLAATLVAGALAGPGVAGSGHAQPRGRGGAGQAGGQRQGGRMAPAEERAVAGRIAGSPEEDERPARRAAEQPPENMEERLYLRERPDAVGAAARAHRDRTLQRLLAQRERLVVERRDEAIGLLEEFIRVEPEQAAEMPDALLRLAELKWEVARASYLQAFGAWQQVPAENRGPEPVARYDESLALYDRILTRHRAYPKYDFVLYMKAFLLVDSGRTDDALALYRRILAEFPRSRFVPDAHMAIAEAYFSGSFDYANALAEYEKVMEHRESELYDLALFKSAWCLWRLNRSREAALRFRQVLDLAQQTRGLAAAQIRRRQELQEEALDYLIQVFTEDENNTAADVFRFLQEIGGEQYAQRVLTRLSDTFFDQARYDRGIEAYALLLQMDPSNEKAPDWQAAIARGHAALDDHAKTIEAMRALAANYGPRTPWAERQADPENVQRARRLGERTIRRQALRYHELAQRDRQKLKYERAAALYEIYLEHYDDGPHVYEIRFYLAEILFHRLERYPEAGQQYLLAARANPRGQYTRDALYNAIGAFEHVREVEIARCREGGARDGAPPVGSPATGVAGAAGGAGAGGTAAGASAAGAAGTSAGAGAAGTTGTAAGAGAAAAGAAGAGAGGAGASAAGAGGASAAGDSCRGESANDRKFAEAIELYVQLFPQDPDLPEILFRQGKLYYDNQIFDPAVRLWGQLLERYPNSEYAATAGDLILDSFNRAQDYGNIERWARRLKGAPAFQSPQAQARLDGLILQSVFKLGEQLAQRGQHAEAAAAYFRAAEEFPSDARARQAYYNAGIERQRAGDLAGASAAYDRLIERHPGSTEGALGAWTAAQMYESIAQFSDAARYYEAYAEKFPRAEKAEDALYNAVLLRVTAGDDDEAVAVGRKFLERFPRSSTADDVYFLIGRAHELGERWADAARTYREYIQRTRDNDRKVEALTRLGQVLLRSGNAREADRAFDEAVRLGKRMQSSLRGGLYYAAQARYLQGDAVLREYEAIRIEGDVAGLRQRLEQKSRMLQRAASIYAEVVQFRVAEWVTAALFQVGHIFEEYAEALRAAPIPEGLNEEERQSYQDQLAVAIVPIEERALEAFEGGYQKAIELRIYNEWTAKLREALTRLNDVQYPPMREIGADIVAEAPLPLPERLGGLRRGPDETVRVAPATGDAAAASGGSARGGAAATGGGAAGRAGGRGGRRGGRR